jgi:hypothetical protein
VDEALLFLLRVLEDVDCVLHGNTKELHVLLERGGHDFAFLQLL